MGSVGTPYEATQIVPIRHGLTDYYCLGAGRFENGVLRAGTIVDSDNSVFVMLKCTSVANQVWTSTKDIPGWATISEHVGLSTFPPEYTMSEDLPLSTASMQYINEQAAQLVNQRFRMENSPLGKTAVLEWLYINTDKRPDSVYGLVGNSLSDGVLAGFKEQPQGGNAVYYYIQNTDGQGYRRYLYLQCSVDGLYGYVEDCRPTTILPEGASNWQPLEVTSQQFDELRAVYNMVGNQAINLKYEHS